MASEEDSEHNDTCSSSKRLINSSRAKNLSMMIDGVNPVKQLVNVCSLQCTIKSTQEQ